MPLAGWRHQLVLAVLTIPATGFYYVQTFEKCSVYTKRDPGDLGGRARITWAVPQRTTPGEGPPERILQGHRHPNRQDRAGSCRSPGPAKSWGGTLATSTGLVIFGEEGGALMAADATHRQAPVEFPDQPGLESLADDLLSSTTRQFIAIASGPNVIAFGLRD